MSRESLQESLSALMDNETDELELRRVLAACEEPQMRERWQRYQLARAAMHGELREPRLDLAAAVSAALAVEEAPVVKSPRQPLRTLGRFAVAASVTVAVLAGVRLYNQDSLQQQSLAQQSTAPSSFNLPQVQGPALLAAYGQQAASSTPEQGASVSAWHQQRLPEYLRQHAQQVGMGAADGALPYARAASMQGN